MDFRRIDASEIDALWELQLLYKAEIGEDAPDESAKGRLRDALAADAIRFYGAWEGAALVGCCSVTVGFSTFHYRPSGVFEDFYIRPGHRHTGLARALVAFACRESSVSSLTVGCADCDVAMYQALGFSVPIGNLLAHDG